MTTLPAAALAQHMAVLGKTGSGKTSTGKLAIEQVVAEGHRVCILDPIKSDWWGLTSSRDGKHAGLPFHILGGPRGHVPLHPSAGKAIGEIVATGALPLSIIDMADFPPGGQAHFFTDFAPALLRKMRGVVYLVIEEAHLFAPKERSGVGQENLSIHWAKTLATAGRSKGVRLILVTQRTQALHNALLGSCDTLIAHRLTAPADQEPVVKWLRANVEKTTADQVASSLAQLKTGTGWLCSGEARIFEKIEFPRIKTYDNTATPDKDSAAHEVKTAPVDPEKLRSIIGDAVEQAKANDPAELKSQIRRLQMQLDAKPISKPVEKPEVKVERVEVPVLSDKETALLKRYIGDVETLVRDVGQVKIAASVIVDALTNLKAAFTRAQQAPIIPRNIPAPVKHSGQFAEKARSPAPLQRRETVSPATANGTNGRLPPGERATLIACAQHGSCVREQLSILTGYKRSSRDAYIARLREKGYVDIDGERVIATQEGINALGNSYEPLPSGEQLQRYWLDRLPPGEKAVLGILLEQHPTAVSREAIDAVTGYQRSSRDAYIQRLKARQLVQIVGRGEIRAAETLFG